MEYKSGNPALKTKAFDAPVLGGEQAMTMQGVIVKSLFLLLLSIAAGAFGWYLTSQNSQYLSTILIVGIIAGLGTGLITAFFPKIAVFTGPLYAVTQGLLLGVVSYVLNISFDGIVVQAVLITAGIFLAMLFLYATRIIKVTRKFLIVVTAATLGIVLYYVLYLGLSLFGIQLPLVNGNSGWAIAFSVFVVIIAALNLAVDFNYIEDRVASRAPKYLEWYAAFSLIVTLLWLYLEILRLLSKVRSR